MHPSKCVSCGSLRNKSHREKFIDRGGEKGLVGPSDKSKLLSFETMFDYEFIEWWIMHDEKKVATSFTCVYLSLKQNIEWWSDWCVKGRFSNRFSMFSRKKKKNRDIGWIRILVINGLRKFNWVDKEKKYKKKREIFESDLFGAALFSLSHKFPSSIETFDEVSSTQKWGGKNSFLVFL